MNTGQVAVVTGAGQGIGRGIAMELAKAGFNIVGNDLKFEPENIQSGLFEVKARVEDMGRRFVPQQGDIASLDDHSEIMNTALKAFGRVDVLVNNAGVAPLKRMDVLETTPESYDRLMAVNARGSFFLTQKIARHMIEARERGNSGNPSIIFITSISAAVSSPLRAEYCISKAALSQAARIFAHRLAGSGISVYEVRPGIIQTDMTSPVKEKYDRLISEGLVPQGRWGYPEDVGRTVAALASGALPYSTGAVLEVSGGMDIRRL